MEETVFSIGSGCDPATRAWKVMTLLYDMVDNRNRPPPQASRVVNLEGSIVVTLLCATRTMQLDPEEVNPSYVPTVRPDNDLQTILQTSE